MSNTSNKPFYIDKIANNLYYWYGDTDRLGFCNRVQHPQNFSKTYGLPKYLSSLL